MGYLVTSGFVFPAWLTNGTNHVHRRWHHHHRWGLVVATHHFRVIPAPPLRCHRRIPVIRNSGGCDHGFLFGVSRFDLRRHPIERWWRWSRNERILLQLRRRVRSRWRCEIRRRCRRISIILSVVHLLEVGLGIMAHPSGSQIPT